MKIIIYTYDLFPGREYLMPWRTLWEVAIVMQQKGHDVIILNGCYDAKNIMDYEWQGVQIHGIKIGYDSLVNKLLQMRADAVFVPFVWRTGLADISALARFLGIKIAYMAGGVYNLQSAIALWKRAGLRWAKPYLIDSLVPKRFLCKKLKELGFSALIGLTEYTAEYGIKGGFANSIAIYPGHDGFQNIKKDETILEKNGLKGEKFILFSGAPAPTRGVDMLVDAVDCCNEDVKIVLLMRTDVGSEFEAFNEQVKGMKHPERVILITEKVTREQLRAFFGSAYYVALPFVVIPSEVPLTFFEVLSCGTPIITFSNGGTTCYLEPALEVAPKSILGLSKVLAKVWKDSSLREARSVRARSMMEIHAGWQSVGEQWLKLIEK
ncbi:MAG: glycosyltransferase [Paraprevotella sp.]|nr:glycosyltransferase [Paraprevotella sp.]